MRSVMGEPEANLDRVETWCDRAHAAGAHFALGVRKIYEGERGVVYPLG
jgi:hypothetical protein